MNKLNNFGPVYVINLPDNSRRRKNIKSQFAEHSVTNYKICEAVDGRNSDLSHLIYGEYPNLRSQEIGCIASHLNVIKFWIEKTDYEYAVIMEDDCVLDTSKFWPWDWDYFMSNIPKDADIIQLSMIKEKDVKFNLHKKESLDSAGIEGYAWSTACYLIKRSYGKKLIDMLCIDDRIDFSKIKLKNKAADVLLYSYGNAYAMPIFTYFVDRREAINIDHRMFHVRSKENIDSWWMKFAKKYSKESFFDINSGLKIKSNSDTKIAFNIFHETGTSDSLRKRSILVDRAKQNLLNNFSEIETPTILIRNNTDIINFYSKEDIKIDPKGWKGRGWRHGELGIWASNYTAWKNFANTDYDSLILMEDDIVLTKDFNNKIIEYLDLLPSNWDFFTVYIPTFGNERARLQKGIKDDIVKVYQSWSCLCYIVSKNGVKKLLNQVKTPVNGPLDHWLFYNDNLNGYALNSGLQNICNLYKLESTIQSGNYVDMSDIFNQM